ncbi:hypothetical protein OL548_25795 [Lysinibacillus sp. MHQ-1]|nr:hypothetical protein OL548_25795 [Lysinibacillus sp. MHQ-1]
MMNMLMNSFTTDNLENVDPIIKQAIRFNIGEDQKSLFPNRI